MTPAAALNRRRRDKPVQVGTVAQTSSSSLDADHVLEVALVTTKSMLAQGNQVDASLEIHKRSVDVLSSELAAQRTAHSDSEDRKMLMFQDLLAQRDREAARLSEERSAEARRTADFQRA